MIGSKDDIPHRRVDKESYSVEIRFHKFNFIVDLSLHRFDQRSHILDSGVTYDSCGGALFV